MCGISKKMVIFANASCSGVTFKTEKPKKL